MLDYNEQFLNFVDNALCWDYPQRKHNHEKEMNVIDFFCGCGGTSCGFTLIPNAFNIVCGIDINQAALNSFSRNFTCDTFCKDIRDLTDNDIEDIKLLIPHTVKKNPLIVIGCAPCQGFSAHRKKDGNKDEDKRNSLIGYFADVALKFNPDYIVMENVQEVLNGKYRSHYEEAKKVFTEAGYYVSERVYNAAGFCVPQARNRAIIVASKEILEMPEPVLEPSEYRTVRDAIGNLPKANDPNGSDAYHFSSKHKQSTINVIAQVPKNGGSRPANVGPKCLDKVKGFYDVYGRLAWEKPSITITKTSRNPASGRFSHPEENRGLTLREAARLQSFPDNFIFCGGSSDRYEQVGEAVPPLLSLSIATSIYIKELL